MRKLSLLIVITLLLSGCSTGEKTPTLALGDIPSCDQIDTSKVTKKTLQMNCLDGSSVINFHSIKGPIIVNVWASWCEGCKEEMPYFIDHSPYGISILKNSFLVHFIQTKAYKRLFLIRPTPYRAYNLHHFYLGKFCI